MMTPLEAAQLLEEGDPSRDDYVYGWSCPYCNYREKRKHTQDCAWLMLPQIVAALESLDQMLTVNGPYEPVVDKVEGGQDGPYYMFCHGRTAHGHRDQCPWNNAVLARRYGEQR